MNAGENVVSRLRANVERGGVSCTDINTEEATTILAELERLRHLETLGLIWAARVEGVNMDDSDSRRLMNNAERELFEALI